MQELAFEPWRRPLAHREKPMPFLSPMRPDVPADLETVFRRLVARKVAERYPSMAKVIAALEGWGRTCSAAELAHLP